MSTQGVMDLHQLAELALELARPSIMSVINRSEGRNALHAIILDPREPYNPDADGLPILQQATFGEQDHTQWRRNYEGIALAKAKICWRTGMSSGLVGERAPYLYRAGDIKYPGGVVCDGLTVAASGLDWQFDEACARIIIALFWAQARLARDQFMIRL